MSDHDNPEPSILKTQGFAAFYQTYHPRIRAWLRRRFGDLSVADELASETFTAAFKGQRCFRGKTERQERAWVFGIARNLSFRHMERHDKHQKLLRRLGPPAPGGDDGFDRVVDSDAAKRLLSEYLPKLEPTTRVAIELHFYHGHDYKTIARMLDKEPGAIRKRIQRAVQQLRGYLDFEA